MSRVRQALDHVHTDLARKGDYAGAIRVYQSMLSIFPDQDPVMLARYECKLEASKTDMTNADAVVGLAQYVESRGFADPARDLYVKALVLKPGQPAALESLNRMASVALGDLAALMNDGQYPLAVAKAAEISRLYPMLPPVVKQAEGMAAQAKEMAAKMAAEAQRQAQLYAERGDTYYQQAQSYLSMYYSTEVDTRVRVVSPKDETVKYLRLAITAWQYALQLDPSTANPLSFDLSRKMSEASDLLSRMTSTSVYMPRYEQQ
jgi:tetratricopeptide (TPR) repeat protein